MTDAPAPAAPSVTPMMAQFLETKARYPDALLFYRMGDFYEMFFDDAVAAAAALDIALTHRGKHLGENIPMCGVPVHAAEGYLARLIKAGCRVRQQMLVGRRKIQGHAVPLGENAGVTDMVDVSVRPEERHGGPSPGLQFRRHERRCRDAGIDDDALRGVLVGHDQITVRLPRRRGDGPDEHSATLSR